MSNKKKAIKYVKNPEIIDSKIDDEVVMMNIDKGHYFGLDSIGSDIWAVLSEPHDISELVNKLTESYDVTTQQCEEDVTSFIERLVKSDLLVEADLSSESK